MLLTILVLIWSSLAMADCPPLDLQAANAGADFQIQMKGEPQGDERCEAGRLHRHLKETILFLRNLGPLDNTPDDFNHGFIGDDPYAFARARVKRFVLDYSPESDCQSGGYAFLSRSEERSAGVVNVCPRALRAPVTELAGVILHEGRHAEGPQYVHQVCGHGTNRGNFSCDSSYQSGGSYAISTEFNVRLWRTRRLPLKLRQEARKQAVIDFMQRFNDYPADIFAGLLLGDQKGDIFIYDGERLEKTALKAPPGIVVGQSAGLPTFADPKTGEVRSFIFADRLEPAPSTVLTDRFAQLAETERAKVKGLAYGSTYACLIEVNVLDCVGVFDGRREWFKKEFSRFKAERLLQTPKSRLINPKVIHIVDQEGRLVVPPQSAEELRSSDPQEWYRTSKPFGLLQVGPWGSVEAVLTPERTVRIYHPRSKTWTDEEALKGRKFEWMLAPQPWSKKLTDF